MSEHKVSAGTMLLFIDPNGGTEYDTVICLKSVSITDSVASIDISSWCGPGKLPGLNDITLSFDGYHIQDPNSLRISGTDLRILLRNKTTIGWKLSPESPIGGDEIQTGIGFIDSLSSTYAFDSVGSFNFTINVKGDVTTTIQPLYYLGMEYGGGIISYIDESGEHGLIRAYSTDINNTLKWSDNNVFLGSTNISYGEGYNNTLFIINHDGAAHAAIYCVYYTGGGYNDWFLPTLNEISAMYDSGQLSLTGYTKFFSSSEIDSNNVNVFVSGGDASALKNYSLSYPYATLPCRYF